mmetsp:Transcript_59590/g.136694  ORF Transcript_59590/g.136694 Transcript_59590/m.136694 type:complete len:109 (-) Transcript_59590:151-477(-)
MLCFVLQLLMAPLHIGVRYYLKHLTTRLEVELVARVALLACMGGLCAVELAPWKFVLVQAALSVAQIFLLHKQQKRDYHPRPYDTFREAASSRSSRSSMRRAESAIWV